MKRLFVIVLTICMLLCFVGCAERISNDEYPDYDDEYYVDVEEDVYEDDTNDATTHTQNQNINTNTTPVQTHSHYYIGTVTQKATCGQEGIRKFTCSCGDWYTETISKESYHTWNYATCTTPKTCSVCGATEGNAEGHNYRSYDGKCFSCDQLDPNVSVAISQYSLELPSLPQSVSYSSSSGKLYSTVKVTAISYEFEYYEGGATLTVKFSGIKTYDYRGSGQSDDCKIGWKLYDPDGNVLKTGTFYSPSIAMDESFAEQEEDLIYNFEAASAKPGAYKLVILDVN